MKFIVSFILTAILTASLVYLMAIAVWGVRCGGDICGYIWYFAR
jgi:hypothetical protein